MIDDYCEIQFRIIRFDPMDQWERSEMTVSEGYDTYKEAQWALDELKVTHPPDWYEAYAIVPYISRVLMDSSEPE